MGVDHKLVFQKISDVVLKTIIAAEPFMLDLNAKSNCEIDKNIYIYIYISNIYVINSESLWYGQHHFQTPIIYDYLSLIPLAVRTISKLFGND